jgi:NhaP-type Na+/H+ or K+/H+ antiporter
VEELLTLAVVAAFILGFGVISKRIQTTVITPPMVFVLFGLLLSASALGLIHLDVESKLVTLVAELTLVLVLFTDAARIDLKILRRDHSIPIRLLALGLPLTMLLGSILGALIFVDVLTFWEAVVLAIVLAPTDAALGQAVVSNPKVPVRIRQALNVESGLNDGIGLPILLFFLSLAAAAEGTAGAGYWLRFTALQLILGPVVGIGVGYLGGRLVAWAQRHDWMAETFQRLMALGLSVLAFALAELIGGNGFIAAFCAGLALGNAFPGVCGRLYEFAEAEGQLLTLFTFMLYGALMVVPAFSTLSWQVVVYALLSLTIIRMLPVAISLIGLRLQVQTLLFLGWFGPRGIASILYCLLVLEQADLAGREVMFSTIMITVFLSVFAHGLTALPASNRYGAHAETMKDEPDVPELMPVEEMPLRLGSF